MIILYYEAKMCARTDIFAKPSIAQSRHWRRRAQPKGLPCKPFCVYYTIDITRTPCLQGAVHSKLILTEIIFTLCILYHIIGILSIDFLIVFKIIFPLREFYFFLKVVRFLRTSSIFSKRKGHTNHLDLYALFSCCIGFAHIFLYHSALF